VIPTTSSKLVYFRLLVIKTIKWLKEIRMKKTFRFALSTLAVFTFTLAFASLAQAQATRTWVSGVGNDADPCSRTAPCKTYAGAQSKTLTNGEISTLDPGGYGTINISKSLTIDGTTGAGFGSILASGTVGVTINLTTTTTTDPQQRVTLRNLSINGPGSCVAPCVGTITGTRGINILKATDVHVENVTIENFTTSGIRIAATASTNLYVKDSSIYRSGVGLSATTTVGFAVASVKNCRIEDNTTGVEALANGFITISDSSINANGDGLKASASGAAINAIRNVLAHNTGAAINASIAGATIRAVSNQIFSNTTGINAVGTVSTDGQNRNAGNATPGAPNGGLITIH
jgi:hypothetical protein